MHLGNLDKAKELIKSAHESGASYVKMQAIEPEYVAKLGSMPLSFYEQCAFSLEEYAELVEYGNEHGAVVFFSVFGDSLSPLIDKYPDRPFKIAGNQIQNLTKRFLSRHNKPNTIISIPHLANLSILNKYLKNISKMNVLYRSDYLPAKRPDYGVMLGYSKFFGKKVGYSDHCKGIDNCLYVIDRYRPNLIEKHFHLGGKISYEDKVFRDSIHSVTAHEFEKIVKFFEEKVK